MILIPAKSAYWWLLGIIPEIENKNFKFHQLQILKLSKAVKKEIYRLLVDEFKYFE